MATLVPLGKVVRIGLAGAKLENFAEYLDRVKTSAKVEVTVYRGWEFAVSYLAVRLPFRWCASARRVEPDALFDHREEFLRQIGCPSLQPVSETPDRDGYHHWGWQ